MAIETYSSEARAQYLEAVEANRAEVEAAQAELIAQGAQWFTVTYDATFMDNHTERAMTEVLAFTHEEARALCRDLGEVVDAMTAVEMEEASIERENDRTRARVRNMQATSRDIYGGDVD